MLRFFYFYIFCVLHPKTDKLSSILSFSKLKSVTLLINLPLDQINFTSKCFGWIDAHKQLTEDITAPRFSCLKSNEFLAANVLILSYKIILLVSKLSADFIKQISNIIKAYHIIPSSITIAITANTPKNCTPIIDATFKNSLY